MHTLQVCSWKHNTIQKAFCTAGLCWSVSVQIYTFTKIMNCWSFPSEENLVLLGQTSASAPSSLTQRDVLLQNEHFCSLVCFCWYQTVVWGSMEVQPIHNQLLTTCFYRCGRMTSIIRGAALACCEHYTEIVTCCSRYQRKKLFLSKVV